MAFSLAEASPAGAMTAAAGEADTARGHGCAATDPEIRRAHYAALGRKGAAMTRTRYGGEFYEDLGRSGGEITFARHGPEFYARIGRLGGRRPKGQPIPEDVRAAILADAEAGIGAVRSAQLRGVSRQTVWRIRSEARP